MSGRCCRPEAGRVVRMSGARYSIPPHVRISETYDHRMAERVTGFGSSPHLTAMSIPELQAEQAKLFTLIWSVPPDTTLPGDIPATPRRRF